jgi:D-alanyl-D-alanine carboxypeptidase/D-alanyl-D-alanine-endopeptidase (penicillin-binding protein 4)
MFILAWLAFLCFFNMASAQLRPAKVFTLGDPPTISHESNGIWEQILTPQRLRGITLGLIVTGPLPYTRNESEEFVPASTTKLFTSALALEKLGPDFRYETRLVWQTAVGDNTAATQVTLIGSGDPTLGISEVDIPERARLAQLTKMMRAAGIRSVWGPITVEANDPRWDNLDHAQGVNPYEYGECVGAIAQGLNFRANCLTDDELDSPLHDVKATVRKALMTELHTQGLAMHRESRAAKSSLLLEVKVYSPPLSDILMLMNKHSDNFIADALFKTLGARFGDLSLPLIEASQKYLEQTIRLWANRQGASFLADDVLIWEGAGLSRQNRATPRSLLLLLKYMSQQPDFAVVWNSLPIAGFDGTLRSRMLGTEAQDILRAKTGTVDGGYQLAGYVPELNRDHTIKSYVPFVMLTSTQSAFAHRARQLQDDLGVQLTVTVNPFLKKPVPHSPLEFTPERPSQWND